MTQVEAETTFGPIVFASDHFVVRAQVKDDGLHCFAFRTQAGSREHDLPHGFMRGHNSLFFLAKGQ